MSNHLHARGLSREEEEHDWIMRHKDWLLEKNLWNDDREAEWRKFIKDPENVKWVKNNNRWRAEWDHLLL